MNTNEAKQLIDVFNRKGTYESQIWEDHKSARFRLIDECDNPKVVTLLLDALNSEDDVVARNISDVFLGSGCTEAIPFLLNRFSSFYPEIIEEKMKAIESYRLEKSEKYSLNQLIEIFSKDDSIENVGNKWKARKTIIDFKNFYTPVLNDIFKKDNQNILMEVAEIAGEIGNQMFAGNLLNVLSNRNAWGRTLINTATALIKINKREGFDFLKSTVVDCNSFRDLRIDAGTALYLLGLNRVFKKDADIRFDGESMSQDASQKLKNLVDKLR